MCFAVDQWLQTGVVTDRWPWSPVNRSNTTLYNTTLYNASLHITLVNDSFVSEVATDAPGGNELTYSILRGLKATTSTPFGFNAIVREALKPSMIERLTDSTLLLHIPPLPSYAITRPETITLRVPASVVRSRATLQASASLEVAETLVDRAALLSGPLVDGGDEILLRAPGSNAHFQLHLVNDSFALEAGHFSAFIGGFRAAGNQLAGWAAEVNPAMLRDLDIYLMDEQTLHVGFPQVPAYDITEPETIDCPEEHKRFLVYYRYHTLSGLS